MSARGESRDARAEHFRLETRGRVRGETTPLDKNSPTRWIDDDDERSRERMRGQKGFPKAPYGAL